MFCFHDRLKRFTFSNGQTIEMCPECTAFDNQRIEVLKQGCVSNVVDTKTGQHWNVILDDADLPMTSGHNGHVETIGLTFENADTLLSNPKVGCMDWDGSLLAWSDIPSMQPHRHTTRQRYTPAEDHDWATRQAPFPHSHPMPRALRNLCIECIETVVDKKRDKVVRITRGVYLPIEHQCNSVRVYDLAGKLLEVKSL